MLSQHLVVLLTAKHLYLESNTQRCHSVFMPKTAFFASAWAPCLLALMQSYGAQAAPSGGGVSVYPSVDGLVDVQSMDVFVEGRRLHALLVAKFSTSAQVSAFYVFSIDGGRTWSKPVSLARKDKTPVISRRGNDAQLATNGKHMVAVWQTRGEFPGAGPMVVAYSGDGGLTWARGESPASGDPSRNQSYMDLTVDRTGRFHLAWLDDREEKGNTQGLRYARSMDGGHRRLAETTIDDAVCTCGWNRLVVSPDQTVSVLYRDDTPHDMRLANVPNQWDSGNDSVQSERLTGNLPAAPIAVADSPPSAAHKAWFCTAWYGPARKIPPACTTSLLGIMEEAGPNPDGSAAGSAGRPTSPRPPPPA
ncbi:MAG TPA: sialidase family protein [Methylococcaceae bacterium]|nr:sialidase family protein [Methylococcaceae bacterium]